LEWFIAAKTFGVKNRVEELIWVQDTVRNNSPAYSTIMSMWRSLHGNRAAAEADPDMFRDRKSGCSDILELAEVMGKNITLSKR